MSKSLPPQPDLRWLRDEAKARRRNGEFPSLALAHLAIAREYGFASWPRLKAHVDALTLSAAERAAILIASACSDDPRRAATILELDPTIARHDLRTACATGEADEVARWLRAHPDAAHRADRAQRLAAAPVRVLLEAVANRPAACGGDPRGGRCATGCGRRSKRIVHAWRLAAGADLRRRGDRRRQRTDRVASRRGC
jgi:hypothetical protein